MDPIDIVLTQMLLANSRTPYRELADRLDLSVNAVHKRIQSLIETGIIHSFTAKAGLKALDAVNVVVYGISFGKLDEISEQLSRDERIYWVSQASGGMTYVGGYLRNIGDLADLSSVVNRKANIGTPTVGIMAFPPVPSKEKELTKLDHKIIYSLRKDARKPVSDIASELSTSAKTVRRRLDRMIENHLIDLSLEWYPDASNDIISMFHLKLDRSVDRGTYANGLMGKYAPRSLFYFQFSNLPDELIMSTWSSTMKDMNNLRQELEHEPAIISSVPYILYAGKVYETWRDTIVEEKAAGKR